MRPHTLNKKTHGIAGWYIDKSVCIDLIKYFENSPNKGLGLVYLKSGGCGVDKKRKLSTDVHISLDNRDKEIMNYYKELVKVTKEYKKKYKYCDHQQDKWGLTGDWNLQKYEPKEGYFAKHCERTGPTTSYRHLVFMTYLNDVNDRGETEFVYQKLKIKPETGLTLIWSCDWTFTHRGIASPTETKYITTGWFNYKEKKKISRMKQIMDESEFPGGVDWLSKEEYQEMMEVIKDAPVKPYNIKKVRLN